MHVIQIFKTTLHPYNTLIPVLPIFKGKLLTLKPKGEIRAVTGTERTRLY